MREVLKIPAGTYFAKDESGKFFPVSEDDPRAIAFTPRTVIFDDGVPLSPFHPAALHKANNPDPIADVLANFEACRKMRSPRG